MAAAESSPTQDSGASAALISLRIRVPETKAEKCLQFASDTTVHAVKLRALDLLGRNLPDKLNYGLYLPGNRGRAGKFLQEERLLNEYPMTGPIGDVELRYKRRIYRNSSLSVSKIKRANSKSNLKHFVQSLQAGDTAAVNMHLSSGLDPNVPCKSNGATALMVATELKRSREMILTLISGGAFLDFRDAKGLTAMHLAAITGNGESIQTLLDLGQSPNCLDSGGLTPLYHSILHSGSTVVAEMLLYDGSCLGIRDDKGLCEIHQACKLGREHHLELLLTYGADINSTSTHGNTPLHVSALANQLECARTLLRRGADRQIKNYQGHNAEDTALLAGNQSLAELIRDFSPSEVTPIEAKPRLNTRRRRTNSNLGGGQSLGYGSRGWGSLASVGGAHYRQQVHQQAGRSQSTLFERDLSMGRLSVSSSMAAGFGATVGSHYSTRSEFVFAGSRKDSLPPEQLARTVVIQRSSGGGFGFTLKGSKTPISASPDSNATSSRQILGPIEPGKPAYLAGMRQDDLVLEINGVDVRALSHADCLQLITGDTLTLKLLTPPTPVRDGHSQSVLSVQSDTEPLRAIDMLDRTLNCYEEIPEDPLPAEQTTQPEPVAVAETENKDTNTSATTSKSDTPEKSTVQPVAKSAVVTAGAAAAVAAASPEAEQQPEVNEAPKAATTGVKAPIEEPVEVLPAPEGFGNDVQQQSSLRNDQSNPTQSASDPPNLDEQQSQIDRKISTIAPLPTRVPPPPPTAPPPPPPPKPSLGTPSTAASVAIIRRRSLLAKPAAATPDHDQELRRLVELRRKKIDSGQVEPSQQIEAQLNRKSAGSRMIIVPSGSVAATAAVAAENSNKSIDATKESVATSSTPVSSTTTKISAAAAPASSNGPAAVAGASSSASSSSAATTVSNTSPKPTPAVNNGDSSPIQLRRSVANPQLADVAATDAAAAERPASFTGKAEQLRQMILKQQQQQHQQNSRKTTQL
ncbi:hypothetical protein BOX15_Mlig033829g3 [Macrostomum lignano]|uniref:PDZ domain-containing protein n=2 Tax=Macrostomum lignano TaxID=282301 RepID=A0A267H6G4_9PLAT|nr:hypothetical protein BOX15_Mlig033829g3 [Macrostomum lignano]